MNAVAERAQVVTVAGDCDCALTEGEFLEVALRRLRKAKATPGHLSAAALAECENERVGEEFSRTPFLY